MRMEKSKTMMRSDKNWFPAPRLSMPSIYTAGGWVFVCAHTWFMYLKIKILQYNITKCGTTILQYNITTTQLTPKTTKKY